MILRNVDSLLYVDTDVLFIRPVELIWDMLAQFNATQLVAMAPEHEEPRIGWYSRFSRHPYYGKTGINSGVMLMNLTRMRMAQFKVRLRAGPQRESDAVHLHIVVHNQPEPTAEVYILTIWSFWSHVILF